MNTNRPRGAKVWSLDPDPLTYHVNTVLQTTYEDDTIAVAVERLWIAHIIDIDKGEYPDGIATVTLDESEGVGWIQDNMRRCPVGYGPPSREGFIQLTQAHIQLPVSQLWKYVDDEHDLADCVRTFGQRLETNFHIWYSRITAYQDYKDRNPQ